VSGESVQRRTEESRRLTARFESGVVELKYDVDWSKLSDGDREFLNGLIDKVSKLGGSS
jgi:hypothetical protein